MTITLAQNAARVSYTVNQGATQTSFTVSFEFFDAADLNVFVDGVKKTISTNYTVSGGGGSTGAVSLSVTGASGGSTVVITRDIALARTTDFPASGSFQIATLNTELDRFTAIAADLKDSVDRSLGLTDFDAAATLVLPAVADRKGKALIFNSSSGNVEAAFQVTAAAVNVSGVSVGGSATASVSVSSGTATFALGIPAGATGATGPAGGGLAQLVADSSPELGGNLDVLAKDIVSSSNRPIDLAPNGTGIVVIHGNTAASATNDGSIKLNCSSNSHGQIIKAQPHSATVTNTMTLPAGASSTLVSLVSTDTLTNKTLTSPKVNGSVAVTATGTELNYTDVTTLGLSQASKAVTADANGVITLDNGFSEEYGAVTSSSNAVSINLRTANNFSHTLTEATTISFANPAASGKVSALTLRVIQDSSARAITWHSSIKWAGDVAPTLSSGNADVDVFVFYTVDAGTTYYGFTAGQDMS